MKMKAQWAVLIALVIAIGVATAVYGMPVRQVVLSAAEGATFGLFPIMWIVVAAIWVYNMTVESGHFAVLRRSIGSVSEDQRVQAVLIAFCFGTLLEALAGFGAPAAITATMMAALGFRPIKAAALAVLATRRPSPSAPRDPDRDALRGHRTRRGRPRRDGRPPDAVDGAAAAVHPPRDGRRPARDQAGMARRARGGFVFAAAQFTCSNTSRSP